MIQTIEGRLGGGKTYTAMGWVCNHLAKGGVVATNINIQLDEFSDQYGKKRGIRWVLDKHYNYTLKDSQIIRLSDVETVGYETRKGTVQLNEICMFYKLVPRGTPDMPVLVIVDEAHIHFPQDGYKSIPKEVLHFLTLSRHACVDVVFISQHIKNMWCQMLRLAQFRWAVRDMQKFGLPFGLFNLPWPFPHILQCKNDYDGSTVMSRKFEWQRKYLFETYKSPELASAFESMPAAGSVKVEKRGLSMKERMYLFGGGVAVGLCLLIVPACKSRDSVPAAMTDAADPLVEQVEKPSLPPVPVTQAAALPETVPEYYMGHVEAGWDSKLFTTDRVYQIGDIVSGLPVVGCKAHRLILFDEETNSYPEIYFESKS